MTYSNWARGEGPLHAGFLFGGGSSSPGFLFSTRNIDDCAEIRSSDHYRWHDGPCAGHYPFLCQYGKVAVTYQRMSSAYACVWRLFVIRCHTLMHVGSTSGGGLASVQSTVLYALVRRSSLRTPRNFMHAQKFSAYADARPVRSEHAMHTLCERSARPRHGRRTLTERPQYADVGGHKMCQFHDEPSACW